MGPGKGGTPKKHRATIFLETCFLLFWGHFHDICVIFLGHFYDLLSSDILNVYIILSFFLSFLICWDILTFRYNAWTLPNQGENCANMLDLHKVLGKRKTYSPPNLDAPLTPKACCNPKNSDQLDRRENAHPSKPVKLDT